MFFNCFQGSLWTYISLTTPFLFHVIFARDDRRMVVYGNKTDTLIVYAKIYISYVMYRE